MQLKVKKLHPDAIIPKYQTKGSAGFDVHALIEPFDAPYGVPPFSEIITIDAVTVLPMSQVIIKTGLAFSVPEGYEMQIRPRSGLAAKHSITITNSPGTLDNAYLDELFIILYNLGTKPFMIEHGDRIAQCVINKIEQVKLEEVEEFPEDILKTDRGGGLGSTGIK